MRLNSIARIVAFAVAGLTMAVLPLAAQTTQEPSIADAARQSRAQKKTSAKTGTVVTNDTLSSSSSAVTATSSTAAPAAPGQAPASSPSEVTAADRDAVSPQPQPSSADHARLKTEIAGIQEQLKEKQTEVNLQRRLLALDQEDFQSKPDNTHDTAGKAKLVSEEEDLKQKEAEFEKLKAKLESLAPQEPAKVETAKP